MCDQDPLIPRRPKLFDRPMMSEREGKLLAHMVRWQIEGRSFSKGLDLKRDIDLLSIPRMEKRERSLVQSLPSRESFSIPGLRPKRDGRNWLMVLRLSAYGLTKEEAEKWIVASRCGGWRVKLEWKESFEAGMPLDQINGARYLRWSLEKITRMGSDMSDPGDYSWLASQSPDDPVGSTFGGGRG